RRSSDLLQETRGLFHQQTTVGAGAVRTVQQQNPGLVIADRSLQLVAGGDVQQLWVHIGQGIILHVQNSSRHQTSVGYGWRRPPATASPALPPAPPPQLPAPHRSAGRTGKWLQRPPAQKNWKYQSGTQARQYRGTAASFGRQDRQWQKCH